MQGVLEMYPAVPNAISRMTVQHGDAAAAFASAHRTFAHTFTVPSVHQGYLEPHACIVSVGKASNVDVWISHKGPHVAQRWLADVIGVPQASIRVNPTAIGGDFGGKGNLMDAPLCYYLAHHAGRPVKMVMDYFEELTAGNPRHSASITLQTALDRHAKILGMKGTMVFDSGAYAGFCPLPTLHGYLAFAGAYRVPSCSLELLRVYTNKVPAGHMRSPGGPQITFAVESHLDMIAHMLQIDPYKFRYDNAIEDGDLSPIGERRRSIRCKATIDAAMDKWDWKPRKAATVGRGIALYEYPPGTFDRSNVIISIGGDGKATVVTGAPDTGTGFHTVLAQLVAEHLGIAFNDVSVVQRDTTESGYERGASGSRLTTTVHQAVIMAATASKAALRALAAEHFACDVSQVRQTRDALFQAGNQSVDLKSLMSWAAAHGKAPIIHTGHNNPSDTSDVTSFAVQIAEVDVDVETGQVKVKRVVTAHDVGLILNPITHQGQIEGGLVQGIGQALCEQLHFQDGAVVSATLGDYKLPTIADIPELVTVLVPSDDEAGKAIGEMSNAAIGAAIANAVYDAVGVRLTELPLNAEKIYNALQSKADAL
jgi:CO/xanthine dehydrogenase Mo-binding subunit